MGGYISGSYELINFIKRHSMATQFGVTMCPVIATQILSALKVIQSESHSRVKKLLRNSRYFRQRLAAAEFEAMGDNDSPVVPVLTGSLSAVMFKKKQTRLDKN